MFKNEKIRHVVLTGGVGSRLWPLSRKSMPKQYIEMFDNKSLFEMTIKRNIEIANEATIVGNVDNYHLSKKATEKLDVKVKNIVEATPRDTAAAIAFAAFSAKEDEILIVTPSDHIIQKQEAYKKAMVEAIALAEEGNIVTFGINPTKPETGYGYIEHKENDVLSFREKPNKETAEDFIEQGGFLWNSGMFCFKASVLLEELKYFEPEIYKSSEQTWLGANDGKLDKKQSMSIPSMSIDYAVMERSKKMKVVKGEFEWSDLGSFESVYHYLINSGHEVDADGNMVIGSDVYTAFLGTKNTIFVHTEDANLILQKNSAQDVKKIYKALNKVNSRLLD